MSAPLARRPLHCLLCLLLALSLALPALGLAHVGPKAAQTAEAEASALAIGAEADAPCPMHAEAAQRSTGQAKNLTGSEVADCCENMATAHHACGDDCSGCDSGCGALRLPAGLESLGLIAPPAGLADLRASALAPERADAPQPNLLRPPALG